MLFLEHREMTESRSQSTGRPKIVLMVTSKLRAKEMVMAGPEGSTRGSAATDDCSSKVAMVGRVEIRGIANGTTKFNWFTWIGVVERDEFDCQVGWLRLEPSKMEQKKVTGV